TRASIPLIKLGNLKGGTHCFENNTIVLKGIDTYSSNISTFHYSYFDIPILKDQFVFHSALDSFPIPFDSIVGYDFLKKFPAKIDREPNTLRSNNSEEVSLRHIVNEVEANSATTEHNSFKTTPTPENFTSSPRRCEKVINVEITNTPISKQGIWPKFEIEEGVYLCESLVSLDESNHALTTILNTKTLQIPHIWLQVENFEIPTITCLIKRITERTDQLNSVDKMVSRNRFRKSNINIDDPYPLPNTYYGNFRPNYFSTLDLASAFHAMDPKDAANTILCPVRALSI
ncbi:hypothetical protein HHI36_024226, partial [Cryptolaemus montrouzieri]